MIIYSLYVALATLTVISLLNYGLSMYLLGFFPGILWIAFSFITLFVPSNKYLNVYTIITLVGGVTGLIIATILYNKSNHMWFNGAAELGYIYMMDWIILSGLIVLPKTIINAFKRKENDKL